MEEFCIISFCRSSDTVTLVICYLPSFIVTIFAFTGLLGKFVKLISEPISVLLEDERNKAGSKEHNQAVVVFFYV